MYANYLISISFSADATKLNTLIFVTLTAFFCLLVPCSVRSILFSSNYKVYFRKKNAFKIRRKKTVKILHCCAVQIERLICWLLENRKPISHLHLISDSQIKHLPINQHCLFQFYECEWNFHWNRQNRSLKCCVRIRDIIGIFFSLFSLLIKQIDGNFVVELLTNEYKRQQTFIHIVTIQIDFWRSMVPKSRVHALPIRFSVFDGKNNPEFQPNRTFSRNSKFTGKKKLAKTSNK